MSRVLRSSLQRNFLPKLNNRWAPTSNQSYAQHKISNYGIRLYSSTVRTCTPVGNSNDPPASAVSTPSTSPVADGAQFSNMPDLPPIDPSTAASFTDAASAAAMVAANSPPECNFVISKLMGVVDYVHVAADVPYWGAIVLTTIAMRLCLLPVALKTIQGSARMAAMRPEMQKVQDAMSNDPNIDDMRTKSKYQQQMMALFKKHQVNPLRAFLWPMAQFPVFIASFLAFKDMGLYYPDLSTGGTLWFTDLSAPDSMYILPVFNSLSFLAMIEVGADGVQLDQQKTFKMVMRGLAVAMIPLTLDISTAVFVYWSTNNVISLAQTAVLKSKGVKSFLNIPEAPAPQNTPNLKIRDPMTALTEALAKERSQGVNAKAEILRTTQPPPGPPPGPPPTTFTMPPRKSGQKGNRSK